MERSPYPRIDAGAVVERRRRAVRAWLVFAAGTGFSYLGVAWFVMKPSVNYYSLQDLAIGCGLSLFGLIVRRSAQRDLMRLKGLVRARGRGAVHAVLWLPWYLHQPDSTDGTPRDWKLPLV